MVDQSGSLKLGQFNALTIKSVLDMGALLDGGDAGDVLLPRKHMPDSVQPGSQLDVFVYLDSDDMLTATTVNPKVTVGQCAYLKVLEVNQVGAFLDWGLPKDLLLPYAEQPDHLRAGMHVVVFVYIDQASKRIVASTRLSKHLQELNVSVGHQPFKPGDEVQLLFCGRSELGYKAVINHTHLGLLHHADVYRNISVGSQQTGYIKSINPNGKINLALHLPNKQQLGELSLRILEDLQQGDGTSTLTDKSDPMAIKQRWQVSKGSYKKALGALYKKRLIEIYPDQIKLVDP